MGTLSLCTRARNSRRVAGPTRSATEVSCIRLLVTRSEGSSQRWVSSIGPGDAETPIKTEGVYSIFQFVFLTLDELD